MTNSTTRHIWLLILGLLCCWQASAAPYFSFNSRARKAYDQILCLRFAEAYSELSRLKAAEPDNLIADFLENYLDFFTVFINENESEFLILEKNRESRLRRLQSGPADSPYFRYAQAEVNLQWALARLKFGHYLTAFREISRAHGLLQENLRRYPGFVANQKSIGILQVLVGTIPDRYRWGVSLLSGIRGSLTEGRRKIEAVLQDARSGDFIFEQETVFMYALVLLHLENQEDAAWQVIRSGKLDPSRSPLACFALANVAMRTGHTDEAIRLLEGRPQGRDYFPFHYLSLLLGSAKLTRLDADADQPLYAYVRQFKGVNYIREAWQKLAWHALLLKNDTALYGTLIAQCKTRGGDNTGNDRNARKEAERGIRPDPVLLKARLLFDGGYYARALQVLQGFRSTGDLPQQLEYEYRMGRILHRLNRTAEAIGWYEKVIGNGSHDPAYFACNAALQAGLLYESQHQPAKARASFRRCLSMQPDEHASSLHQKAKAGLQRLGAGAD